MRLVLYGEKAADGMVMDFVELKRSLKKIVEELDHRILLPSRSKDITIKKGREVEVLAVGKRYVLPKDDVLILDISQTSAEELAEFILARLVRELDPPPNVSIIEVGLDEERGQTAWVKREVND